MRTRLRRTEKRRLGLRWWVELFLMNGGREESISMSVEWRLATAICKRCPGLEFPKVYEMVKRLHEVMYE